MHASVCRLYQNGECKRGRECPLLHALPLTRPPAAATAAAAASCQQERDDITSEGASVESSENWTSSSGSRSWADMSEDMWFRGAGPPGRWHSTEAGGRPGGPGGPASRPEGPPDVGGEFPSFSDRVESIPEFLPHVAGHPAHEFGDDAEGQAHKSKSAIRRRQRQMTEKWAAMKEVNSATSLPVVQALQGMSTRPPLTLHAPRTESASPERPAPPTPSPRRPRRRGDDNDQDDSGDDQDDHRRGGRGEKSTKVSL